MVRRLHIILHLHCNIVIREIDSVPVRWLLSSFSFYSNANYYCSAGSNTPQQYQCPLHSSCPQASTSISACTCDPGYEGPNTACALCPLGKFKVTLSKRSFFFIVCLSVKLQRVFWTSFWAGHCFCFPFLIHCRPDKVEAVVRVL